MTVLLSLLLQSPQPSSTADAIIKAAIGVGVAQLVAGAVLLIGWYYVQRRFVSVEFPGVIQRLTSQMASLEAAFRADIASVRLDLSGVRTDVGAIGRQLERHDERLGHQGRRIDRLESRIDNDHERRRNERERDLDDTRPGR